MESLPLNRFASLEELSEHVEPPSPRSSRPLRSESPSCQNSFEIQSVSSMPTNLRLVFGASYFLVMLAIGVIVIGLEINLVQFAELSNTTTKTFSSALLTRAAGSIIGSFLCAKMLHYQTPHYVILQILFVDAGLLLAIPFITSGLAFQFLYFGFGLLVPITEAGVQYLTCEVHKEEAGPWLQLNSIGMWIATVAVPLLHYYFGLEMEYFCLGCFSFLVFTVLLCIPNPLRGLAKDLRQAIKETIEERSGGEAGAPRLQVSEVLIACMLFWVMGALVQITSYMDEYIMQTRIVPEEMSDLVLITFLTCALAGQGLAVFFQSCIAIKCRSDQLLNMIFMLLALGSMCMLLLLFFPTNVQLFWLCIAMYGFLVCPVSGYCYDLWNKMCVVSETGVGVVIFGAYSGSGLVTYTSYLLWTYLHCPQILIIVSLLGCVVPLMLLLPIRVTHLQTNLKFAF